MHFHSFMVYQYQYIISFICQKRKINKLVRRRYATKHLHDRKNKTYTHEKHMIRQQIFFVCLNKFAQLNEIFGIWILFYFIFSSAQSISYELVSECESILFSIERETVPVWKYCGFAVKRFIPSDFDYFFS